MATARAFVLPTTRALGSEFLCIGGMKPVLPSQPTSYIFPNAYPGHFRHARNPRHPSITLRPHQDAHALIRHREHGLIRLNPNPASHRSNHLSFLKYLRAIARPAFLEALVLSSEKATQLLGKLVNSDSAKCRSTT